MMDRRRCVRPSFNDGFSANGILSGSDMPFFSLYYGSQCMLAAHPILPGNELVDTQIKLCRAVAALRFTAGITIRSLRPRNDHSICLYGLVMGAGLLGFSTCGLPFGLFYWQAGG